MNNFYLLDTPSSYKYLIGAAEFYMGTLLPRYKTLEVCICVESALDEGAEGFTENSDGLSRPREFLVSLSKNSENILLTLAHECIHIKQYVLALDYNEDEAYTLESDLYNLFIAYKG